MNHCQPRMTPRLLCYFVVMAALAVSCGAPEVGAELVPDDARLGVSTAEVGTHVAVQLPNPAGLGYHEYLPQGYSTGTRYPLIVYFHGAGDKGNGQLPELDRVLRAGPPMLIENGKQFPAIVISPQLPSSQSGWWSSITTPFVNYILSHYKVDPDRIYVTGLSLGGGGAWMYAKSHPDIVAALVPICGTQGSTGYEVLRGMPIWAFHHEVDPVVPYVRTTSKLKVITGIDPELNRPTDNRVPGYTGSFNGVSWVWRFGQPAPPAAENPILTTYEGTSHNAWTPAYNNQAMWDWLFQQRRGNNGSILFQQDFQGSTTVASYYNSTAPNTGQFNDISSEATGGSWSISQGRLQIVRTGSSASDNDAGITRHTDFAGPPALLHVSFELGVSNWTISPYQTGAMTLSIGNISGVTDYGNGDVSIGVFQTLAVNGRGPGQYVFATAGAESAVLASNGTMHRAELFLNKSNTAASYRAPDGTSRTLRASGVALWVDGNQVVDANATNGSSSTLTDLRVRFSTPADGTWALDNMVIRNAFPQ